MLVLNGPGEKTVGLKLYGAVQGLSLYPNGARTGDIAAKTRKA